MRDHGKMWLIRVPRKNVEYLWKASGRYMFHVELPRRCPEILWMIHRMLPGRQAGHCATYFATTTCLLRVRGAAC